MDEVLHRKFVASSFALSRKATTEYFFNFYFSFAYFTGAFLTIQERRFAQFASILPRALYFRYVIIKCCYWKTWSSHLKNAHHSNFNALITAHQSCWKQTYEVENVKYNKTNERLTIELQRWTLNVNRNSNVGKTQACLLQGPTPIQRGYHCCFRSIPCWRHYFFKGMRKIFNKFH